MVIEVFKQIIKRRKSLYEASLTVFFLLRQIKYFFEVFPNNLGLSKYDWLPNRRHLRDFIAQFETRRFSHSDIDWDADEHFYLSLQKKSRIFPISFSWPNPPLDLEGYPFSGRKNFAVIVPGESYSFKTYDSYLSEYRSARYGVTIKKGGWDCFRHLEILAAGALPIMPDIDSCPEWAMAHYPKSAMKQLVALLDSGKEPSQGDVNRFESWFNERLSSEAMAAFMLQKVGFSGSKILFLDITLDSVPDYLSVMTFVGLKKILGPEGVFAPFGCSPVYVDWNGSSEDLHGLGFGYTQILPSTFRSTTEASNLDNFELNEALHAADLVIVANISRSRELANYVSNLGLNPDAILYLWGDDQSPTRSQIRWIKNLNGFVAIREFYGSPKVLRDNYE